MLHRLSVIHHRDRLLTQMTQYSAIAPLQTDCCASKLSQISYEIINTVIQQFLE